MLSSLAAVLAVAAFAATPADASVRVAEAGPRDVAVLDAIPADELNELMLQGLPPPPAVVVRTTRYYGTVVIDHRAHLKRRNACKGCHGPYSITKIEYTAKVAHQRCIGCHQEEAKGPTKCQDCHVKTKPPPAKLIATGPGAAAGPPPAPVPNPSHVAAALSASDAAQLGDASGELSKEPFHRYMELGFVAGRGPGASVRIASHQDRVLITQSLERIAAFDEARTLGLLGAGISRPLRVGLSLEALALGGFDVFDRPVVALLPVLGARAGVSWRTGVPYLNQVNASLTCVVDLSSRRAGSHEVGGVAVYGTVATGFPVTPK